MTHPIPLPKEPGAVHLGNMSIYYIVGWVIIYILHT